MKNTILVIALLAGSLFGMQAQDISQHAIGVRLGDNDGVGAEVSYQLKLKENNRLELDLGWRDNNNFNIIKVAGLYQWVFNLDRGFNWYVGPGAGVGFWSIDDNQFNNNNDSGSFFFLAGDIGLEYNFEFPLLISIDFRTEIGFGDSNNGLDYDIGIGVRYQF